MTGESPQSVEPRGRVAAGIACCILVSALVLYSVRREYTTEENILLVTNVWSQALNIHVTETGSGTSSHTASLSSSSSMAPSPSHTVSASAPASRSTSPAASRSVSSAASISAAPSGSATAASHNVAPSWDPALSRLQSEGDMARALRIKNDPLARQRFFFNCLNASFVATCKPRPDAFTQRILSPTEWAAHVNEILTATHRMRREKIHDYSGYYGPWIENHFIRHFLGDTEASDAARSATDPVASVASAAGVGSLSSFYPLVPIFVQWTDGAFGPGKPYHHDAGRHFFTEQSLPGGILRPDTLYITLTQHDVGEPAVGLHCDKYKNLLILSAGGWGSTPIPLIKGSVTPTSPGESRDTVFIFVGKIHTGRIARDSMARLVNSSTMPAAKPFWEAYEDSNWRGGSSRGVFTLAPRGFGRTSFRLTELLHSGRVVIYLTNDDTMWVPYQHSHDWLTPVPPQHGRGAPHDMTQFGAVLLDRSTGSGGGDTPDTPLSAKEAAALDVWSSGRGRYNVTLAQVTTRVLNNAGMWGPGGVGFAMRYTDLPAFACIACEFLLPGSAVRWRHVRMVPLYAYNVEAGVAAADNEDGVPQCPCTEARWHATLDRLSNSSSSSDKAKARFKLPDDSLIAEMERRIVKVVPDYFTYAAAMKHVEAFVRSPLESELVCIPKPATYGHAGDDLPNIR